MFCGAEGARPKVPKPAELTLESIQAIRTLVMKITVHPDYYVAIKEKLGEISPFNRVRRHAGKMVAEEGVEPPTPGL